MIAFMLDGVLNVNGLVTLPRSVKTMWYVVIAVVIMKLEDVHAMSVALTVRLLVIQETILVIPLLICNVKHMLRNRRNSRIQSHIFKKTSDKKTSTRYLQHQLYVI